MSVGIDEIYEMLSWNNDEKIQELGIIEAKKIKNLSVLFQPMESKNLWENCAKVLASKSDQELQFYLTRMFRWLQDMNWPGAYIIYNRLKDIPFENLETAYSIAQKIAIRTDDFSWKLALKEFKQDVLG